MDSGRKVAGQARHLSHHPAFLGKNTINKQKSLEKDGNVPNINIKN
jgi:hypothetical protein